MRTSGEAFWWSLFAAGGVLAALFIPVFALLTGFMLPFSGADRAEQFARVHGVVGWWPVRLLLLVVIGLTFFHCAHRIRHVVMDLGVHGADRALATVCYGGALLGTLAAVVVVFRL